MENKSIQNNMNRAENQITKDSISKKRAARVRQNSRYNEENLPSPDNNLFWENESNPLSSKGDQPL